MTYSLKQAAEATGKSKPTILRAIQSGKISAKRDDHNEWWIEPAELHRVYPPVTDTDTRTDTPQRHETPNEIAVLQHELASLREMLAERERRVSDKDEVIADLRERLDREGEERRKLFAMLTDQRAKPEASPVVTAPEPAKKRGWFWRRSKP